MDLANAVVTACDKPNTFNFLTPAGTPIVKQIEAIATKLYGAATIDLESQARKDLERIEKLGLGTAPVCMAKTHLSLSHDPLAAQPAHRLHPAGARPGGRASAPGSWWRCAARCSGCRAWARRRRSRTSTSTRTAIPSGFSRASGSGLQASGLAGTEERGRLATPERPFSSTSSCRSIPGGGRGGHVVRTSGGRGKRQRRADRVVAVIRLGRSLHY